MSADQFVARLKEVQGRGPRWRAICPAHESRHGTRALSVYEADDGRVLVKCHAGCDVETIVGAVGMELRELFPPKLGDHSPRIRRPWPAREIIRALRAELHVAWIVLVDAKQGKTLSDPERVRAGIALDRIGHFMRELDNAH